MKKLFSILIICTLVLCTGIIAWAEDAPAADVVTTPVETPLAEPVEEAPISSETNQEVAALVTKVKAALGLGDDYANFYGYPSEDTFGKTYYFSWSNAQEEVSATVDAAGLILNFNRYNYGNRYSYSNDFAPSFPKQDTETIRQVAAAFLAKVLQSNETAIFEKDLYVSLNNSNTQTQYFYGTIAINGVTSPLYFGLDIDLAEMQVTSFYRDSPAQAGYIGSVPNATPTATASAAAALLSAKISMTPAYYRDSSDDKTARIQYRPDHNGNFLVDAQTGTLIDLDKLYEEANETYRKLGMSGSYGYAEASMADDAGGAYNTITEVEQAGLSQLEGLLSKEQLDAKAKAITELGLTGYTYSSIRYEKDWRDTDSYLAYLSYYTEADAASLGISAETFAQLQEDNNFLFVYKNVTLDAKTGTLVEFYTNQPYVDSTLVTAKAGNYQEAAQAFLTKYFNTNFSKTKLAGQTDDASTYYNYTQQVNGYDYSENYYSVYANPYTGAIESFYYNWQDDITFAPASGLIGAEKAKQIYLGSLECKLSYNALPQAIDPAKPEMTPYINYGYTYISQLTLVYAYQAKDSQNSVYAVDGLSGEAISHQYSTNQPLKYDDLDGVAERSKIEELAKYGCGFDGGSFKPQAELTELDMLVFLLSARGYYYTTTLTEMIEDEVNSIYQEAYANGLLEKNASREPERKISRGELLKTLISMSGYGKTAQIPSIYVCDFADAQSIPSELYGYIAIAQGLGLVESGSAVTLNATGIVTRAEAAAIFYNFLARKY